MPIDTVGQKQFDRLTSLLHPDLEFRTPGGSPQGLPAHLGALRRLGSILVRNDIKKVFVDGADVCVIYDSVTDTPAGAVASVEWLTIQDGRVRTVWLLFARQRWPSSRRLPVEPLSED